MAVKNLIDDYCRHWCPSCRFRVYCGWVSSNVVHDKRNEENLIALGLYPNEGEADVLRFIRRKQEELDTGVYLTPKEKREIKKFIDGMLLSYSKITRLHVLFNPKTKKFTEGYTYVEIIVPDEDTGEGA
jgi:hypothetical protein